MAHFAEIDNDNQVVRVVRVDNNKCVDADGIESEQVGVDFLKSLYGENTNWAQTSYNGRSRQMYAGQGYIYLPDQDIFVPPNPFPSWTLNRSAGKWVAPVPEPEHDELKEATIWNEDEQKWYIESNEAVKMLEDWKKENPTLPDFDYN